MATKDPSGQLVEGQSLEDQKLAAEVEKLKAETADLSLAWWKRPTLLTAVLGLAASAILFASGVLSGYFNDAQDRLREEQHQLTAEIGRLETIQSNSELRVANLSNAAQLAEIAYQGAKANYGRDIDNLQTELKGLTAERDQLRRNTELSRAALDVIHAVSEIDGKVEIVSHEKEPAYRIELLTYPKSDSNEEFMPTFMPALQQNATRYSGRRHHISGLLSQLANLQYVTEIAIDSDKYPTTGEGLQQLESLPRLERLRLQGLDFTDKELSFLGKLNALKTLELDSCRITTAGWRHVLSSCPSLERLESKNILIARDAVDLIASRISLRSLAIVSNGPLEFGPLLALRDLHNLELMAPTLGDYSSTPIANFKQLKLLSTSVGSDAELLQLSKLKSLSSLNFISLDNVTTRGLNGLANLTQLKFLYMNCYYEDNQSFSFLEHLDNLEELHLTHANITDDDVIAISNLNKLRVLDLHGAAIDDQDLVRLTSLGDLESLNLSQIHLQTYIQPIDHPQVAFDQSIPHLRRFPKLTSLYLDGCALSDAAVNSLRTLTTLKDLTLTSTGISPEAIDTLRAALPSTEIASSY